MAGGVLCAVSALAQSAPELKISTASSNQLLLTVTNGTPTGIYQIYFSQSLGPNPYWYLLTNGVTGQLNFAVTPFTYTGFYKSASTTNSAPLVVLVTIEHPLNGSNVQ